MSRSVPILIVALGLMLAPVSSALAGSPAVTREKCEVTKIEAAGKRAACLATERAKDHAGKASDPPKCETKFTDALRKADEVAAKNGASCRFIDNGDGTITDLNTGLQWEQKVAGSSCLHCVDDTYTWSAGSSYADGTTFTSFLGRLTAACGSNPYGSVAAGPIMGGFAGHCDWRLPTIHELLAIRDLDQGNCGGGIGACIDPSFGPTAPSHYWSATTYYGDPGQALPLYFSNGSQIFDHSENTSHHVRAVRGPDVQH